MDIASHDAAEGVTGPFDRSFLCELVAEESSVNGPSIERCFVEFGSYTAGYMAARYHPGDRFRAYAEQSS